MPRRPIKNKLLLGSAQKDPTFSSMDIIRISCLNLTRTELRSVILFFMIGVPLILASEQLDFLFTGLKIPKSFVLLIKRILKALIGSTFISTMESFGFRVDVGDIEVFMRIVKRLHKLFPR